MTNNFDAKREKEKVVAWIRKFFEQNGKGCNAVLGISGGKDSSVAAALCVEALGKEHVYGVLMPNGVQPDIDASKLLVEHLGIPYIVVNIADAYKGILNQLETQEIISNGRKEAHGDSKLSIAEQTKINLAPRLRMASVYAVSQSLNGRVVNTCNLSEDWIGYSTRYGDSVGDFSPLSHFTVQEVKALGRECGLPDVLVDKTPSDGLSGKTDEDNLGFTYEELDQYIREGTIENEEHKVLIDNKHKWNKFKLELMPAYDPDLPVVAKY